MSDTETQLDYNERGFTSGEEVPVRSPEILISLWCISERIASLRGVQLPLLGEVCPPAVPVLTPQQIP